MSMCSRRVTDSLNGSRVTPYLTLSVASNGGIGDGCNLRPGTFSGRARSYSRLGNGLGLRLEFLLDRERRYVVGGPYAGLVDRIGTLLLGRTARTLCDALLGCCGWAFLLAVTCVKSVPAETCLLLNQSLLVLSIHVPAGTLWP